MSNEMIKHEAAIAYRTATNVAGICKAIVLQTAVEIQHRKYVRVEGWQAIAGAHGCVASAKDVERIQGGIRAIGEIRRGDTGAVLATAEGFVGDDEDTWGQRPEYAKRAMAQTRAISRACRSAFAHVVVMMNAGLETTPAEEVPMEGFTPATKPNPKKDEAVAESLPTPAQDQSPRENEQRHSSLITVKQAQRLFSIARNANVTDESLREHLRGVYGIEHTKEIRRAWYDAICAWAEAGGQNLPDPVQDPDRGRKDGQPF